MTVKIVTDSMSDIPRPIAEELDIEVVPASLHFGQHIYRDGVDITPDEFYSRLQEVPTPPGTFQPTPQDFANVYHRLKEKADDILSIHISSKLSGSFNSAMSAARKLLPGDKSIEVIDSQSLTTGFGLLVIEAAKLAKAGMGLPELMDKVKHMTKDIHMLGFFDTLKYLAQGGRIGQAKALMGSLLNIKPILTMKDGEILPVKQVRTRARATDCLCDFVRKAKNIKNLSIIHSTTPDEAAMLAERLDDVFPKEKTIISQLGSALGVHGGPGILFVCGVGEY
jgi:DegV family protein with EDD domain